MYPKSLIFLASILTACVPAFRYRDADPPRLSFVQVDTPECAVKFPVGSVPQRVLSIMCSPAAWLDDSEIDPDKVAASAGPAPVPVEAALAIVECVGSGRCATKTRFSYGLSATLHHAASTVTPEMVRDGLAGEQVGHIITAAFVKRYAACRAELLERVDALGPRFAHVYLAPLDEARRRWMADVASAAQVARYEAIKVEIERALLDGSASAALVAKVAQLRDEVVAACRARGRAPAYCLGMPIARPLTFDLVRLYIALGDGLAATVEANVGARVPDRTELSYELHLTAEGAMAVERARAEAYREAQEHDADPKVLAETFGPDAPLDLVERANSVGVAPPDGERFDAALRRFADVRVAEDELASVTRAAGAAVLHWKATTSTYQHTTNCHETDKIDYVGKDGSINYRVICTGPTVDKTIVHRKPEVRVPLAEARDLRAGDIVSFAARDADARVLAVYAPGPNGTRAVKQIGALRVGR